MRKLLFVTLACCLCACKSTTSKQEVEELVSFSTYEKTEAITDPDGVPTGMTLGIDIPQGKGGTVDKITNIIRTLITESEIGEQIGAPKEGTLQEVCDDYIDKFKKGIASRDLTPGCAYHLEVLHGYQTSEYICFHISDGVYGNGGPMEREVVVRLSDERILEQEEIINIPDEELFRLAKKYAPEDQKETAENMESLMSCELVPDEKGCKFHYAAQSIHFFEVMYFPVDDIQQYLTDEGRKIFGLSDKTETKTATKVKEEEKTVTVEPGRGELGIFDLRGPVKELTWKYVRGEKDTYGFDKNGFWITKNGKGLKALYINGIERDNLGRIKVGHFDYYEDSFTYNSQGLVTEHACDGVVSKYTYDKDGYLVKEFVSYPPDMGDEEGSGEEETFNYTILEKDDHGNWTKRKCRQGTETRKIEYY